MSQNRDVVIKFGNVDPGSLSTLKALFSETNTIAKVYGKGTNMEVTIDNNGDGKRVFKFPEYGGWEMKVI